MARQTNPFQQLVTRIEETYRGPDSDVTESAPECEPDGTAREVDVLVRTKVAEHNVKIAIECRDRKATETVEWVDSVVGKYSDLQVDKVVLISSSGFSAAAVRKAQRKGIGLYTLRDVTSEEAWPASLTKLWVVPYVEWTNIQISCEPRDVIRVPAGGMKFEITGFRALAALAQKVWHERREAGAADVNRARPTLSALRHRLETSAPLPLPMPLPAGVEWRMNDRPVEMSRASIHVVFWGEPMVGDHSRHLLEEVGTPAVAPAKVITEIYCQGGVRATAVQEDDETKILVRGETPAGA